MKILIKISNILINILIIIVSILLLLAVYNFLQLNVLKKHYTNYFGYTYFEILTGSMEDEIKVNDYVFVKITKDVEIYDVISFINDDEIITHRIMKIDGNRIVTKGDNNNVEDDVIDENQIIGKVVYIGKEYGKYFRIITEPLVFIPFFITILFFSIVLSKEKEMNDVNEKI